MWLRNTLQDKHELTVLRTQHWACERYSTIRSSEWVINEARVRNVSLWSRRKRQDGVTARQHPTPWESPSWCDTRPSVDLFIPESRNGHVELSVYVCVCVCFQHYFPLRLQSSRGFNTYWKAATRYFHQYATAQLWLEFPTGYKTLGMLTVNKKRLLSDEKPVMKAFLHTKSLALLTASTKNVSSDLCLTRVELQLPKVVFRHNPHPTPPKPNGN